MITKNTVSFLSQVINKKQTIKEREDYHKRAMADEIRSTEALFKWMNEHATGEYWSFGSENKGFPIFKVDDKEYIITHFFYSIPWKITFTPIQFWPPLTIEF